MRRFVLVQSLRLLMLAVMVIPLVPSSAADLKVAAKKSGSITLTVGKADVVNVGKGVADVLVANPDIVDVGAIKAEQLYLIGTQVGTTNISVFDDDGGLLRQIAVQVNADKSTLEQSLKTMFPGERVKVSANNDDIILSGRVSDAETAAKIRDLAQRFATGTETVVNKLQVTGNQQVMIKVKVVEVSRNVLNELGIETDITSTIGDHLVGSGRTADGLGLTVDPSFGTGSLVYSNNGVGPIELVVRALERDGLVNTLAQPNLTAVSGENARFLAGGEFPIPSARDENGNITYEYRPFGVSLAFRPVVLNGDHINLQISTEVSEVSGQLTLQLPGVTVPSFTVRRAETTVDLNSGGSLMIAGLIQSQAIERMNRLPGIGSVPVLGALVSSESFSRNESELLVIITAFLVEPFADDQAEIVETDVNTLSPLNGVLAEQLARTYGKDTSTIVANMPFGYIME